MVWHASPLKYASVFSPSIIPSLVGTKMLNTFGSVNGPPQSGHLSPAISSALKRRWHFLHSTSGSTKLFTCPEASHTFGLVIIAPSIPTTLSCSRVIHCHHRD